MAITVSAPVRILGLNPPPGSRLPEAMWIAQVTATGDVSGGTVTLTANIAPTGKTKFHFFTLEAVSITRLDATADTGLLSWGILEGQFDIALDHSFQINLTPGGGQATIRGDQLALLLATRNPSRPDQAVSDLRLRAILDTNTNGVSYRLQGQGFMWDGDVALRGGATHP